jgi:hypothetical protein
MEKIIPLSEILRDLVEGGTLGPEPAVARILEVWPGLVPDSLRPFVVVDGVRNGVLVVTVAHPVAGQQLQFIKEDLRGGINRAVGRPLIRELRIKMGPLPPAESAGETPQQNRFPTPRALTRKEKGAIKRLAGEIKNSGVRERVQTLMEKSLRFNVPESDGIQGRKPRAARKPSKPGEPSFPPPRS